MILCLSSQPRAAISTSPATMRLRRKEYALIDNACYAVLSTPELLENILSCLSMRNLLTIATRISRRWNALVTDSPHLRRLLFFQSEQSKPPHSDCVEKTCNPLLAETFPLWFTNPTVRFQFDAIATLPIARRVSRREAFLWSTASWRRMLVSQPPIQKLGCWMAEYTSGDLPDDTCWKFRTLSFPEGLRMGKLYDLTQRWLGDINKPTCAVYWTPHSTGTLSRCFWHPFAKFDSRRLAKEKCCAAVDMIVMGERWYSQSWYGRKANVSKDRQELAQFRKDFTLKGLKGAETLGPASNNWEENKYKRVVEFAAGLDTTGSTSA
jgi:hypothetical protein